MSMIVKNNMSAVGTLNTLNKNSKALSKSLEKVSSGTKINSASDGASEYAISERMRSQIRALDQANQNTQNGKNLLSTADGAIGSTLEILRTLKEKAINAANDSNNEETDRKSIQKEVVQLLDQIDDNANVAYNGKVLNNGTLAAVDSAESAILRGLNSSWIQHSLEMIRDAYGLSFESNTAMVHEMNVELTYNPIDASALAYVTAGTVGATTETLTLSVNMNYYNNLNLDNPNGVNGTSMSNLLDRTIAHEMTHAVMAANITNIDDLPDYVMEGLAELTHGIEDTRLSAGTFSLTEPYGGGFVYMRYLEHNFSGDNGSAVKRLLQALARNGGDSAGQAIAVSAATNGRYNSFDDLQTEISAAISSAGADFLSSCCGIDLNNDETGGILGWNANRNAYRNKETVVADGGIYSGWTFPHSSSTYYGLTVTWPEAEPADPSNMLKFHTGAKANNLTTVGLGDMRCKALGLRMIDGGAAVSLESRGKAEAAIALFEAAIDYTLEQQTRLGAIQKRLEYDSDMLTTSSENTQASESTIRDSDMAKEMTEYTKNNVLLQASQSMLAQANQNSSAVLSLLQ